MYSPTSKCPCRACLNTMLDLHASISSVVKDLQTYRFTAAELAIAELEKIKELNSTLNCFISIDEKGALEMARLAQDRFDKGKIKSRLQGVPICLKDNIAVKSVVTTCGSGLYLHNIEKSDSRLAEIIKNSGAVILGKTNMSEFAWGFSKRHSYFGFPHNPWSFNRITGGSSSGSAVAISTGLAFGSFGTDTTGSVRIPASFCGIVGLKPTFDLISATGIYHSAKTLDHVGILARTVEDTTIILDTVCKKFSSRQNKSSHGTRGTSGELGNMRILVPVDRDLEPVDEEVLATFHTALEQLGRLGMDVVADDNFDFVREGISRLARSISLFEGSRIHSKNLIRSSSCYPTEVKEAIAEGKKITPAIHRLNLLERKRKEMDLEKIMEGIDLIATPTVPFRAYKIGQRSVRVGRRLMPIHPTMTKFTTFSNVCRVPAISIPCGFDSRGMPIGLQLVGKKFFDRTLLQVANKFEMATKWTERRP